MGMGSLAPNNSAAAQALAQKTFTNFEEKRAKVEELIESAEGLSAVGLKVWGDRTKARDTLARLAAGAEVDLTDYKAVYDKLIGIGLDRDESKGVLIAWITKALDKGDAASLKAYDKRDMYDLTVKSAQSSVIKKLLYGAVGLGLAGVGAYYGLPAMGVTGGLSGLADSFVGGVKNWWNGRAWGATA
jgi:hypothetical protein